ncbi:MAG: prolyl oligopeptidase family serine peptidase [Ignavibacteriaceae bacterium]
MFKVRFLLFALLFILFSVSIKCQSADSDILIHGMVIKLASPDGNSILSPNSIVVSMITNNWKKPYENEHVKLGNEIIGTWQRINPDSTGWFRDDSLINAYIYFRVNSDKDDIALLEGMGDRMVFINGIERSGSPYRDQDNYLSGYPRFDYSIIPFELRKGTNEFLFECRRGYFKAEIHRNKNGIIFNNKDLTIPDLIVNKKADTYGAIPIINATKRIYKDLLVKTWSGNSVPINYSVDEVSPLSIFKIPFRIMLPGYKNPGNIKLNIEIVKKNDNKDEILSSTSIELKVVEQNSVFKETFISSIDSSVQYYAVNPPSKLKNNLALFLSLHGAGVEAYNQARAYYHKDWGYIVCPTNRRPYGYDWENWGRIDALEVLKIVKKEFNVDENRIYLTGHSMGGHGVWHLGVNYPDKFGAIGPSAGWISFWSYGIKALTDSTPIKKMLVRSTKQSDTYAFTMNVKPDGIYIIQGDADDNVPMRQANSIVANLSKFHKDFIYYVQHGAGHWWDLSDEPGTDCVDWAPMFDFFAHHAVAGNNRTLNIDFTTANPAISYKDNWVEIINQKKQQTLGKIKIRLEPGKREFVGHTYNIELFRIDASMLPKGKPVSVLIDNQYLSDIHLPKDEKITLQHSEGNWNVVNGYSKENKYPLRCGNFREALNHNVIFVYGTHGNKKENEWAFDKARFDAEELWYQGNSSIRILKDDEFNPNLNEDRSVILFGNSKTNSAYNKLVKESPVQINENNIKIGEKVYKGDDIACLMIRPRPGSKLASVGVISGTGIKGMDLVDLAQYYDEYVSFPDIVVYDSKILNSDDKGVIFTGYFGNDWSVKKGEFVGR